MTAEQILGLEISYGADRHARQHLVDAGKDLDVKVGIQRKIVDPADYFGGGTRDGHHDGSDRGARCHTTELRGRAEDPQTAMPEVLLAAIIIDEADWMPFVPGVSLHRLDELTARFAGADDEHRNGSA